MYGDKQFDNLGFPTPDAIPEETGCRQLTIPSNSAWFGVVMGALELLTHPENWQQYEGGISREDAAAQAQQIVDEAYALAELGQCSAIIETPYWDTAANVVTDEPVDTQPWYGVLYDDESSFRENVENWALAGLVAYAAGAGAAIAFLTIARRFRIAVRTHDLGGIVRAFIDGAQVAEVDTYSASPNIVFLDIFADKVTPDAESWTLWVEQPNDDKAEIVRMELNENDVYPNNQRYDSGTDTIQTLGSDGTTWEDTPDADPRHSPAFQLPPVVSDDQRCQAASNMTRWISNFIGNVLTPISEAVDATALLTLLVSLLLELGPFAILIDVVIGLAALLFSAGATAIAAAFTNTVYDTLTCIFYCRIADDGTVSPQALTAINSDIHDQLGGLVETVLSAMFFLMGEVGLTNAGVVGADPSPNCDGCTECEWCYTINFNNTQDVFAPNHLNGGPSGCGYDWGYTFIPGQGLVNVGCISLCAYIQWDIDVEITQVQFHSDTPSGTSPAIIFTTHSDFQGTNILRVNAQDTGTIDQSVATGTYLGILLQSPSGTACGAGNRNIDSVTITGKGLPPFGWVANC